MGKYSETCILIGEHRNDGVVAGDCRIKRVLLSWEYLYMLMGMVHQ